MPSAFAVLKVNFFFCSSQKALRLKVYSFGTGTQGRDAYQSQQGMMINETTKTISYRTKNYSPVLESEKV
jgi:hypothetical protein